MILAVLAALLAGGALGLWGYMALLCAAFFVASRRRVGRVSDRQRDVPARDPRDGDRALLRDLDRHRRRRRPAAVRQAAGRRRSDRRGRRLLDRGGPDGRSPRSSRSSSASTPSSSRSRTSPSRCRRPEQPASGTLRRRPAGQQVGDELVDAFLEPAAALEQVLGERAHVEQRVAGLVEIGREDEIVGGVANASLLAGQELRGPQLGECLYNAPVGQCAFVGHDT